MNRLHKFLGLPLADRRLLLKAALLLGAIRLGSWLLPFQSLRQLVAGLAQTSSRLRDADRLSIPRVAWAVATVSRNMPKATCLTQALATQVPLGRRGHPAHLRIGAARSPAGQLQAHAWVESEGTIVIGRVDDLSRYTLLPSLDGKGL
jgi:hypothetical protein